MVHETAIIAEGAQLGRNVVVGPFSIIGAHVEIGDNCTIGAHTVIEGWTSIGNNNRIGHGVLIGVEPPDDKYNGEKTFVEIGSYNKINNKCTIHRGTAAGGGVTSIGNHNNLMENVHIAHDCRLHNHIKVANNTELAGHVEVEDYVVMGGKSGVHQFVTIGKMAMVGGMCGVTKNILPYSLVMGIPARAFGINRIGMQRNGLDDAAIQEVEAAFTLLGKKGPDAVMDQFAHNVHVQEIIHFIQKSEKPYAKMLKWTKLMKLFGL